MSEASDREEMPDRPGRGVPSPDPAGPGGASVAPEPAPDPGDGPGSTGTDPGTDSAVPAGPAAPADDGVIAHERVPDGAGGRGGRNWWGFGRRRGGAGAGAGHEGRHVPTGLAASLVTSGGLLLAMVEDLRMRGEDSPEEVRPLADTFARHCAAKEATVRKVLERHGESARIVARDRQEGDLIQGILDRALTGRHPEETRHLTVDGALTQMYQYLFHERRDLVPALERAVPFEESETLAAAFEAINNG
ncbi:hypothetical protein SAMN05216223_109297 [Actinacidiphila yanglinensis]|uniref:Uncharacterized protein n=1 Tax=Actinacidiphila yanglinensis TaxID=310779 RepID=A0A1H6CPI5_9ACTN|nr:hypothetical protein [Actinacidiphila yanglinensis]SEG74889.1 hypothetical protein SAMN05216223_109297 [Actinacidiphila yanglinensis]